MRHYYLFIYDISCPKRQAKIRRLLQAYATGRQKSLYECNLHPHEQQQLCNDISELITEQDSLHYFITNSEKAKHYGIAHPLRQDYFIIS